MGTSRRWMSRALPEQVTGDRGVAGRLHAARSQPLPHLLRGQVRQHAFEKYYIILRLKVAAQPIYV